MSPNRLHPVRDTAENNEEKKQGLDFVVTAAALPDGKITPHMLSVSLANMAASSVC